MSAPGLYAVNRFILIGILHFLSNELALRVSSMNLSSKNLFTSLKDDWNSIFLPASKQRAKDSSWDVLLNNFYLERLYPHLGAIFITLNQMNMKNVKKSLRLLILYSTMHRGIRPLRFIHEKNNKKGSKTVPWGSNPQLSVTPLTVIFIHFAPFRSGVQNPFCNFFMDKPQFPCAWTWCIGYSTLHCMTNRSMVETKSGVTDVYKSDHFQEMTISCHATGSAIQFSLKSMLPSNILLLITRGEYDVAVHRGKWWLTHWLHC